MAKSGEKKGAAEPALDLSLDTAKELKVSIRGSVFAMIGRYVEFYEQAKGVKRTPALVVERGLEKAFSSDKAFMKFLNGGSGAKRGVLSAASPAAAAAES